MQVDEVGSEAAAATAVIMNRCMAMPARIEPKKFIADHPFFFVLAYEKHPLFAGRLVMN